MAHLRLKALDQLANRPKVHVELPSTKVADFFGENVFTLEEMRAALAPAIFKKVNQAIKQGEKIDEATADAVASAAKN